MRTRLLLLPFLFPLFSVAQTLRPDTVGVSQYVIVLNDSTRLEGRVLRADEKTIVVRLKNGRLTYVHPELYNRIELLTQLPAPGATPSAGPATTLPADTAGRRRYRVLLSDGTWLWGRIVRRDSANVVVRLAGGNLSFVPVSNFAGIDLGPRRPATEPPATTSDGGLGRRRGPNRFTPFLLFNETAYNAERNRLYYRNIWLLYNELQYGLTRHWSVGTSVVPFLWFLPDQAFARSVSLNTKVSVPIGSWFRLAFRTDYTPANRRDVWQNSARWNLQLIGAIGDNQRHITLGYGRLLGHDYGDFSLRPAYVRVGAVLKLTPGLTAVTDNTLYIRPVFYGDASAQYSFAFRIDRPHHAFDLGLMGINYNDVYPNYRVNNGIILPYLGYNLRINGRR